MSSLVFVDLEISTQADGAQSSRVPVPLPEDPYEAIRKAYLDGMNTESEHFEDLVETETPESPLTVAPPTSLPESTPPTVVPILRKTARMAMRVPPAMSSGLSASMAEVADMFESAFCKRFRSSYESSPSLSPPNLPSRKRYRGTSELVEDDDEEDEEIEESLDSDSVSEDAEDAGPTAEDDDPVLGDEGLAMRDEGQGIGIESRGLDDEGHSVKSDGLRNKRWKLYLRVETEEFLTEQGRSSVELQEGLIHDHAVKIREYRLLCLREHEQERVAVTFRALWRLVLALESQASQTDA
ncbi:hypothetical protein Tco_0880732 [Tanacetum coccineum]